MELTATAKKNNSQLAAISRRFQNVTAKKSLGPIGMDLGRTSMRAVQIQYGHSKPLLKASLSVNYPYSREELLADRRDFKRFINTQLRTHGFRGNKVVTCSPTENLRILSLDYPVNENVSEEETIVELLRQRLGENLQELVIDYIPVRNGGERRNCTALVAIAELDKQIEFLELLRYSGLEVCGLEIGPIAIRRLVENIARIEHTPNVLVVNCGTEHTYLTVTSGRRLLLDRSIAFGENYIVGKVASSLDMEDEEIKRLFYTYGIHNTQGDIELLGGLISTRDIVSTIAEVATPVFHQLTHEIEKVISYVHAQQHGAGIQQIYLLGSIARWRGADEFLASRLLRPVEVLNPFDSFLCEPGAGSVSDFSRAAGMAIASGCALSELR